MSWLKKEAAKAEKILKDGSETAEGPIVVSGYEWDWEDGPVAEAIERVARAFAERALREIAAARKSRTPLGPSHSWCVSVMLPAADSLYGLGFATKEDAEAWLAKSIAEALASADKDEP